MEEEKIEEETKDVEQEVKEEKKIVVKAKKKINPMKIFNTVLLSVVMLFVGCYLTFLYIGLTKNGDVRTSDVNVNIKETDSITDAVENIYDAVVVIQTFKGQESLGSGSGFVYKKDDKNTYILTNQHVVEQSESIKVLTSDGRQLAATYLGGDSYADLAVLKIDGTSFKTVASIGSSEKLKLGDTLFAVGSPLGSSYAGSVTRGILSGKDRMITVSVAGTRTNDWIMKVIQTDAAINPGNSGGPLCNAAGQVIGVISMKFATEEIEGMGFAIPIEYAMDNIEILEKGQKITRPYLGIEMADVSDTYNLYRAGISIDPSIKEGVVVVNVLSNTAAANAGLQKGDVIVKIGDAEITSPASLKYNIFQHKVGDQVEIEYFRGKDKKKTKVVLTQDSLENAS